MDDSVKIWMPMYWEKFFANTEHLNATETGAYTCLIGHYWMDAKPLANNDERLRRLTRMSTSEWKRSREIIMAFFVLRDGLWWHETIEKVLADSQKKAAIYKSRASQGGIAAKAKRDAVSSASSTSKNGAYGVHFEGKGKGISDKKVVGIDEWGLAKLESAE